jgi:cytochrome c-type biogenesis protein
MASTTAMTAFAIGAGTATFFSPCVYALLPGYVSYYVASVDEERAPSHPPAAFPPRRRTQRSS